MRNDKASLTSKINLKRLVESIKRVFWCCAWVYQEVLDFEARLESQESVTSRG
jgi:hypothetical protein